MHISIHICSKEYRSAALFVPRRRDTREAYGQCNCNPDAGCPSGPPGTVPLSYHQLSKRNPTYGISKGRR